MNPVSPPPIPPELTPEEKQEFLTNHGLAHNLQHKAAACYLYASADKNVNSLIPTGSFELYLTALLEQAGNPSDPIERMLIEQLALAHHNLGRLYVQAAEMDGVGGADGRIGLDRHRHQAHLEEAGPTGSAARWTASARGRQAGRLGF